MCVFPITSYTISPLSKWTFISCSENRCGLSNLHDCENHEENRSMRWTAGFAEEVVEGEGRVGNVFYHQISIWSLAFFFLVLEAAPLIIFWANREAVSPACVKQYSVFRSSSPSSPSTIWGKTSKPIVHTCQEKWTRKKMGRFSPLAHPTSQEAPTGCIT